ncbi:MAG: hypothetical protein VB086_11445 [Clostridiaceae bacterium]|nr:hypothetical protein [Clostridiaceae bacterium]
MDFAKRISVLELAIAIAVGGVLAVYRVYFAGENGFTRALIGALGAVLLIIFAVVAEGLRPKAADGSSTPGRGYMTLLAGSGVLLVLAAGLFWLEGNGVFTLLTLLKAAFPAACGIAALIRLKHGDRDRLSALLCLFPVFYLCFLLLMFYRTNGRVPDERLYGFETAALIALLLGVYLFSATRFEKPKPRRFAVFSCLGIAAATMELTLLLLDRTMLLTVSGFGWGGATVMLGLGLQLAAGLFFPGERLPKAEEGTPESGAPESGGPEVPKA